MPFMKLIRSINQVLDRLLSWLVSAAFAIMIVVVFVQVLNRNVLAVSLVWTLDVAQLAFSWCIFIGAALALRWDEHYSLDLIPAEWKLTNSVISILSHFAISGVVGVLIYNGWILSNMAWTRVASGLEIPEMWFFLPIPLGAMAMACFLAELIPDDLRRIRELHGGGPS
jgi:TRAP-type C4-dicarboxylate transport system permease small subunit